MLTDISEILRVRLKDTGQNKLLLGFPPYNSATVKLFLDLLYGKVIPEPKWSDLYIYKAVIIFAKEYKCPAIMRFILGTLQSLIDIDPFDAFCAGSYVGDLDLCAKAIAAGGNHSFFVDYPGTATQEAHIADNITDKITGGSIFNIASWQSSDLEYIKHAHVIALARATADVNWKKPAKQNWAKIASRFLELTKPQGKLLPTSCAVVTTCSSPSTSTRQKKTFRSILLERFVSSQTLISAGYVTIQHLLRDR